MSHDPTPLTPEQAATEARLAALAMALPEAYEENPWGHRAFKVRKKVFVFVGTDERGTGISVKLPETGLLALERPNAEPTGYGLGKAGWVSLRWPPGEDLPLDDIEAWIRESYRAIAPKTLARQLGPA